MVKEIQGGRELEFNYLSAAAAYILMVVGLNVFVIPNIKNKKNALMDSLHYGALFGLIVYGIYDFTAGAIGWG